MSSLCLHCFVAGRVQGVSYRKVAVEMAATIGVTGWIKNLADGRVEVVICGEEDSVFKMRDWLWQGSKHSEVESVLVEELSFQEYVTFEVRE